MTTENKTLLQRLNAVRKAVSYIQKDKSVSTGGGSYSAVSHDAVTGILREHLIEHGIIVFTNLVDGVFHPKEGDSKQRLYEATFEVTFINVDNRLDAITVKVPAHALDNGDKAPGKAISYATKYALLKTFNIETGEDEESRYQNTEFDIVPYLEDIEKCKTIDDLKTSYAVAYAAATDAKDKDAQAAVIKCKNRIKGIIEAADSVAGQA